MIFDRFRKEESVEETFTRYYNTHYWKSKETVSGKGSELEITKILRKELPIFLKELNVKTLLDIPCGDFNWMKEIDLTNLDQYIGADIVSDLIDKNKKKYQKEYSNIEFKKFDVRVDNLPRVDVILCRDLLIHFSFDDIVKTLENIKKSNSKFIMTTSFPSIDKNVDIKTGGHHHVNLLLPPFSFPKPFSTIKEFAQNPQVTKYLGLWEVKNIPDLINLS